MNTLETINYLQTQKEETEWVLEKKNTKKGRTLWQNSFFYWLFNSIEKQSPFSTEVIKQYILWRVFWKKEVYWDLVNNKTQTSKLEKKEADDLINWLIIFCEENWLEIKYTNRDFENLLNTYQ